MALIPIVIGGQTFQLEPDEGGWYWFAGVPRCLHCTEPLVDYGHARKALVNSQWHDEHNLECASCGEVAVRFTT